MGGLIRLLALLGALAFGSATHSRAQTELEEMILNATRDIGQNPRNPELYRLRAELHRAHRDWDAAHADLDRATTLSNQWPVLHLARARLFLDAGWFQSAKVAADRFLAGDPAHVEALVIRARAQVKLGDSVEAAVDYTLAIQSTPAPAPELYLERAQALAAAGGQHLDEALRGLEEGLRKLGPLVTLESTAIDLEVQQNRVDAALKRLDQVMAQHPRKETWLARRGEILQGAGRNSEATAAFQAALQALDALPPARRSVPATLELEKRIRAALAKIGPPPSTTTPGNR